MSAKTINWYDLQLFLAVAREGGLSSASKIMGCSAATLGRRMYALENELGKELFIRHDRGYGLLPDGIHLRDELTAAESKIEKAVSTTTSVKRPIVKISAGTWTTLALIQNIDRLTGPDIDIVVRFVTSEKELNISRREINIGFRNQRPTDPALACKKLNKIEFAPFAISGAPERWILTTANIPSANWLREQIKDNASYQVNSPRNGLDLALAGKGKLLLPTFIGRIYSNLVQKGPIIEELNHYQWLVMHQDDRNLLPIRNLLDRIYDLFQ